VSNASAVKSELKKINGVDTYCYDITGAGRRAVRAGRGEPRARLAASRRALPLRRRAPGPPACPAPPSLAARPPPRGPPARPRLVPALSPVRQRAPAPPRPAAPPPAGDKAHYLAKVAIKDGTVFGLFVSAPAATFEEQKPGLRKIFDTFTLL
jgi:hypothetical protein